MNKRPIRLLSVTIAVLLLASVFSVVFVKTTISSPLEVEPKGIDDVVGDVAVEVEEPVDPTRTHHSYWVVGDQAIWLRYGSGYPSQTAWFTLGYIGTSVEIWVQNNIKFPTGDQRNGPNDSPVPSALRPTKPTTAMLEYYANQFETNILPKESEFFGPPLSHDGVDAQLPGMLGLPADYYYEPTGRTVILVSNIRDANYYNPNWPYYVIGSFVSAYTDYYFDRNCVNIDAISWFHGLGPAGTDWGSHYYWPTDILHNHPVDVSGQYAYDSTLAHEWQHLLHYELAPGDQLWMNEGCSMYAEFLCNYGIDPDYPNSYFATPDNSLTEWGDHESATVSNILADYGAAGLWAMYLADRYGAEFLRLYFLLGAPQYGIHGIDGINYALYFLHYNERFPDVYRDWTLANLIRADSPGAGKYNYKSLNLNDPVYIPVRIYEIDGLPVPWTRASDYFGNTITILGYDTGISKVLHWGTDYTKFDDWTHPGHIYFDGDDTCPPPPPHLWTLGTDGYWYSGTGEDLADEYIRGDVYVNPTDPTLTIVTRYDLEPLWDFGFVQVSTDGGNTWTSLANTYTTVDHDPSAHPDIIANLPGLTDQNPDWPNWTLMNFDLTTWAGQTVTIGFHYMTDWGYTATGWWIQNPPHVGGAELILEPWVSSPPASFQVTTVTVHNVDGKTEYIPNIMPIDSPTNTGTAVEQTTKPNYVILVVTPTMPKGWADYQFKVTRLPTRSAPGAAGYKIAEPKSDY